MYKNKNILKYLLTSLILMVSLIIPFNLVQNSQDQISSSSVIVNQSDDLSENVDVISSQNANGSFSTDLDDEIKNASAASNVMVDANGGKYEGQPSVNYTINLGATAAIPLSTPTRSGYEFDGWDVERSKALISSQYCSNVTTYNGVGDFTRVSSSYKTNTFAISMWAYMDNWSKYSTQDMRMLSCTENGGYGIETYNDEYICFAVYNGVESTYEHLHSNKKWSDLASGWHHFYISVTRSYIGTSFYVDHSLIANKSGSFYIEYNPNNIIYIGAEAGNTDAYPVGNYFEGKISNFIFCSVNSDPTDYSGNMLSYTDKYIYISYDGLITAKWVPAIRTLTIGKNYASKTTEIPNIKITYSNGNSEIMNKDSLSAAISVSAGESLNVTIDTYNSDNNYAYSFTSYLTDVKSKNELNSFTYKWNGEENLTKQLYITQYYNLELYPYMNGVQGTDVSDYCEFDVDINSARVVQSDRDSYSAYLSHGSSFKIIFWIPSYVGFKKDLADDFSNGVFSYSNDNGITGDQVIAPYLYTNLQSTYVISYNLNGGDESIQNPTTYDVDSATIRLINPTKIGYTFTGWTGSNGSVPQTSVSVVTGSTDDKEYTANWVLNSDEGSVTEPTDPETGDEGTVTEPTDPETGDEGTVTEPTDPETGDEGTVTEPTDPETGDEGTVTDPKDPDTNDDNAVTIDELSNIDESFDFATASVNEIISYLLKLILRILTFGLVK